MVSKNKVGAMGWSGRVLTVLAALPFVMSAVMKFMGGPQMIQGMGHFGWPESMLITLGVLEAGSVVLYLIPQTAVLGAIVLTGYLGGALSTHLRIGEPVYIHVVLGFLIWGGLYLRDSRLRELIPLRKGGL
jgi:uncharacterized membrane protein YphA (DoxX/SURF4 family)